MKYFKRCFHAFMVMLFIVACGQKSQIFLEKDGILYEIGEQVSFYYPKDYEIDPTNENKEEIRFIKEQEVIEYTIVKDDTVNKVEDMPTLYEGELEAEGAIDISVYNVTLDSGMKCQNFTGVYNASGMYFKHIVYFTNEATYIYSYQAPKDVYEKNIDEITPYLKSLAVHHENISSLE